MLQLTNSISETLSLFHTFFLVNVLFFWRALFHGALCPSFFFSWPSFYILYSLTLCLGGVLHDFVVYDQVWLRSWYRVQTVGEWPRFGVVQTVKGVLRQESRPFHLVSGLPLLSVLLPMARGSSSIGAASKSARQKRNSFLSLLKKSYQFPLPPKREPEFYISPQKIEDCQLFIK